MTNNNIATTETETLESRIRAHLANRLAGQLLDARLSWRDDALVLQGRTRSYYVKQMAQQIVLEAMPDQRSLINEIEVF
jgi:hypothetical protein